MGWEGLSSLAIQLGREGHDVMGRAMREVPTMASMEEFRTVLLCMVKSIMDVHYAEVCISILDEIYTMYILRIRPLLVRGSLG